MVLPEINYEEMANRLQKSLDMFGIDDAFEFFGKNKKEWILEIKNDFGNKNEWFITKNGRILMPKLGIC